MFPNVRASDWTTTSVVSDACDELIQILTNEHPEAREHAASSPFDAIGSVQGLNLEEDYTYQSHECPIDGTYDPDTTTIRYRPSRTPARDHFTLLHELGHHLLAMSVEWSLDIAPELDKARIGKTVEERLVSTFASRLLVPEDLTRIAFASGVTSDAVSKLNRATQASPTACLVRALAEPGDRLVMLTTPNGTPWFAQTTGEPWSPGKRTRQPAIEAAVLRAAETGGTYRLTNGEGLLFGTGNRNTNVTFDVTIDDDLVFVIVEPTVRDARLRDQDQQWSLDCLAGCGHIFTPNESAGACPTCGQHKCARCRGCECQQDIYCARCTLVLPTARARTGETHCEECE